MKLIIVGGPPSVGKSSVLIHTLKQLKKAGKKIRLVKLDCLVANDEKTYQQKGFKAITGLSNYVCPDHFLATNIDRIAAWGYKQKADLLVIESAGLCNRCSPYIKDNLAVAVLDMLSGLNTPAKMGPLLRSADIVVLTRGDLISQAEREVFRLQTAKVNRKALIVEINGLTGQGSHSLALQFKKSPALNKKNKFELRYTMPSAVCSFCLGEKRIGDNFASGSVRLMNIPGLKNTFRRKK